MVMHCENSLNLQRFWCKMNIKSLLNLTIDLLGKPTVTASVLSGETKDFASLLKDVALPYFIAIIAAEFVGHVMFGTYMFRDSLSFITNELVPRLSLLLISGLLFTLLLHEILHYYSLNANLLRSFYIITYSFIPIFAASILSGLLPKLTPLFNLSGLYSYYLLWCMLKAEYSDSDNKKIRNATMTSIAIMILLHWALVGCENLIFN
jgi:hypothetical protein